MLREFKLPDVGEGLTEAEIVKWHVAAGEHVKINQTIVEIETAKAVVELPCPFEGTVAALMAEEGQTVDVGAPIISVRTEEEEAGAGPEDLVPNPPAEGAVEPGVHGSPAPKQERKPVLVGYGVMASSTKRRPRKSAAAEAVVPPAVPAAPAPVPAAPAPVPAAPAPVPAAPAPVP
ncbi:biotin/lipoyl-containing protein, partial [Planotetraspora phitsanulokensis]